MTGTGVEVLFVGGPADGTLRYVQGERSANGFLQPPHQIDVDYGPGLRDILNRVPEQPIEVRRFTYVCRTNPLNSGPTWIAVPADPNYVDPYQGQDLDPLPGTPSLPDRLPDDL